VSAEADIQDHTTSLHCPTTTALGLGAARIQAGTHAHGIQELAWKDIPPLLAKVCECRHDAASLSKSKCTSIAGVLAVLTSQPIDATHFDILA